MKSLMEKIPQMISDNHNHYFNMWLDDPHDIGDCYVDEFEKVFGDYIHETTTIWMQGRNIGFVVQTFIGNGEYSFSGLLNFVKRFIHNQLSDFDNWYEPKLFLSV